ncbi:hypothetical protein V8B97DRAFT_1919401 [Scleroderma yunnanense]
MVIDEPLPGLSSLTAGCQTWELPSQTPVTIPQTVESPASSMLAYTTPAQPPLASLALEWQSPSLSPALDSSPPSMAPLQLSDMVSPLQLPHPGTMLAGPQISCYITLMPMMNIEHPTTQLNKAQQLALLLTDVSNQSPAAVDLAQDEPIIAAYNHYANTLVEASWQYQLLLERRAKLETMMQEFQNDNITGMETKELDNFDEHSYGKPFQCLLLPLGLLLRHVIICCNAAGPEVAVVSEIRYLTYTILRGSSWYYGTFGCLAFMDIDVARALVDQSTTGPTISWQCMSADIITKIHTWNGLHQLTWLSAPVVMSPMRYNLFGFQHSGHFILCKTSWFLESDIMWQIFGGYHTHVQNAWDVQHAIVMGWE